MSKALLEQLIDREGLAYVVNMLAEVCFEKSDHIRESWQDDDLADIWQAEGVQLTDLAFKV